MSVEERKVLLLETQLDENISSLRSQKEFMRSLATTYGDRYVKEFNAKEVHSLTDFSYFLDKVRQDKANYLIHFVGHGECSSKRTVLKLTNGEEINLRTTKGLSLFNNLHNTEILFSCCGIGRDQQTLDKLCKVSGASAVFAYAVANLSDYQAFLVDAMLYHLILGQLPLQYDRIEYESIGQRVQSAVGQVLLYKPGRGGGKKVVAWSVPK